MSNYKICLIFLATLLTQNRISEIIAFKVSIFHLFQTDMLLISKPHFVIRTDIIGVFRLIFKNLPKKFNFFLNLPKKGQNDSPKPAFLNLKYSATLIFYIFGSATRI